MSSLNRQRGWLIGVAMTACLADRAFAQQPSPALPAVEFKVEVLGTTLSDFTSRMDAYAELRRSLQEGLPALAVTVKFPSSGPA